MSYRARLHVFKFRFPVSVPQTKGSCMNWNMHFVFQNESGYCKQGVYCKQRLIIVVPARKSYIAAIPQWSRPANLRVGQLCEIVNGAIFGSMITYMRLVKMGQKSQAFLTQMVQFWWGICVSLTLRSWELPGLQWSLVFSDRCIDIHVWWKLWTKSSQSVQQNLLSQDEPCANQLNPLLFWCTPIWNSRSSF